MWVIFAFTVFVAVVIVYNYFNHALDITVIQTIGAIFGPWVGTILGYYFGAKSAAPIADNNKLLSAANEKKVGQLNMAKGIVRSQSIDLDRVVQDIEKFTSATALAPTDLQKTLSDVKNVKSKLDEVVSYS
jgi:hypothetical protein